MVDEPDKLKAPEFPLLEALANITARDFRLGQFMTGIGLDPNQTNVFYRRLVSEAKEFNKYIDGILKDLFGRDDIISQLKSDLLANRERVRTLTVKLQNLKGQTHQKTESLGRERRQLEADSAKFQSKVLGYEALTEFLAGEIKPTTLKAISDLFWDIHTETQQGRIEGRPPPDPARLDELRQNLSQNLRDILRIPKPGLEQEMDALRAENEKLQKDNQAMAVVKWVEHQQGLMDKSPEESQESSEAKIEENFMKHLQSLADKHRNKSTETEPGGD